MARHSKAATARVSCKHRGTEKGGSPCPGTIHIGLSWRKSKSFPWQGDPHPRCPRRIHTPWACLPLLPRPGVLSCTPPRHTVPFAAALMGLPFPSGFSLQPPKGLPCAYHAVCLLTGHTTATITQCQALLWMCTHTHTQIRTHASVCTVPAICCPPLPNSLPSLCSYYILGLIFLFNISDKSISMQIAPC